MKILENRISIAVVFATCSLLTMPVHAGKAPPPAAVSAAEAATEGAISAAFTDSAATGLAGTKRVAITSVTIAFQASTGSTKEAKFFKPILGRETVSTVMAMPELNQELQDVLAESVYQQLKDELTAKGFEVVPESQVKASASYQAILAHSGFSNHSLYANASGDVRLVSPAALKPYASYNVEVGPAFFPSTSYLGWVSAFGAKSDTPGGPSVLLEGKAWKIPGMEVALAKELNAHVVKAYYLVSMGKTESKRSTSWASNQHSGLLMSGGDLYSGTWRSIDRTVRGSGTALAEVGLVNDMSHISFRSPTGNPKWQKVSMLKPVPPKDGDVVVRLATPIAGSTDFFDVQQAPAPKKLLGGLIGSGGQDIHLNFNAAIIDHAGYGREVIGMITAANKSMLGLVKQ